MTEEMKKILKWAIQEGNNAGRKEAAMEQLAKASCDEKGDKGDVKGDVYHALMLQYSGEGLAWKNIIDSLIDGQD